jgi:uncharacterized protein (TIGR03086 family)
MIINMDMRKLHEDALNLTHQFVDNVHPEHWHTATLCPAWDVRQLVNHLVSGNLWVGELGAGHTIEEVGGRLDGDLLGDDPVASHEKSVATAIAAFRADDAMQRLWPLSYGPRPGRVYARQRFIEVLIHGWDIAAATGQDTRLPACLTQAGLDYLESNPKVVAAWGFASVNGPAGADPQARLLGLAGRRS